MKPAALILALAFTTACAQPTLTVTRVALSEAAKLPVSLSPATSVLIDGVGASDFRPAFWQADTLHWVPDLQYPLLTPKPGRFRNIYSFTSVAEPWGWRVFYAGWDGTGIQSDCIYGAKTRDFITFTDRQKVVNNGEFKHVSNSYAEKLADGSYRLLGTSEGTAAGADTAEKPVLFRSADGDYWNGSAVPYQARLQDNLSVANFPGYADDHFNGANVLLEDGRKTHFLFHEWTHDPQSIYWAEGIDAQHLSAGGIALRTRFAPNDIRKFTVAGKDWYLLALYLKGDVGFSARETEHTWFSLSEDARTFQPPQRLIDALGRPDRFIFSVNFVSRDNRLLGVTYGAGENANDASNQIFATWLQKRVVLVAKPGYHEGNGGTYLADGALGPDRQRFTLPGNVPFDGKLVVFDDDGTTLLGSVVVHLEPGAEYRITYVTQP